MSDINAKTILLIGRTGRGKSTLANVVTNSNNFKESSGSVSETKKVQLGEFKDTEIGYTVIDTPGIGDTKMSDNEVLDIIAKAVYLARDGVDQVFFVFDGRFDQYEMATYDLLRTIIFDEDISKHTTIVRTRFPSFKNFDKCQEDINEMVEEIQEKNNELEKKAKKMTTTSLVEIIKSCQGRIVYVDNPSTNLVAPDDEDEEEKKEREKSLNERKNKRKNSREVLLEHLRKSCHREPYRPEKLKELSEEIADDYFEYLKKKEELQKELEVLNNRTDEETSIAETDNSGSESRTTLARKNKKSIFKKIKRKIFGSRVIELEDGGERTEAKIVDPKELIAQLQDKKAKLQKEIQEKEKVIRQKVLKHIFNNYQAISEGLGGDIFLNSVAGEHDWLEINSEFADKELVVKWLSQGFDYEQTKKWVAALGNNFDPKIDAEFCMWLRDAKKLTIERMKRSSYPYSVEQLRNEYTNYLKKETEILGKHSQQLSPKQELSQAQQWLDRNYPFEERKSLKELNFRNLNLEGDLDLKEFTNLEKVYLAGNSQLGEIRNMASYVKIVYKNPQEFLSFKYPNKNQVEVVYSYNLDFEDFGELVIDNYPNLKEINILNISNLTKVTISNCSRLEGIVIRNFAGSQKLILNNLPNLKEFNCSRNKITSLDLITCPNLQIADCSYNCLVEIKFTNTGEKLETLNLSYNKFNRDLSFLSGLRSLKGLGLEGSYFKGGLEPLKNMSKLKILNISNTDIDSGLEYLPNIEYFYCSVDKRPNSKVKVIEKWLRDFDEPEYNNNFTELLKLWKKKHQVGGQSQVLYNPYSLKRGNS